MKTLSVLAHRGRFFFLPSPSPPLFRAEENQDWRKHQNNGKHHGICANNHDSRRDNQQGNCGGSDGIQGNFQDDL